jgi:glycosyltransferase involved in cell wall biosynthesis
MKIVYFIDHLHPDGTQRVLKQLVQGLALRGHRQAVVCLGDRRDDSLIRDLHASGAQVRVAGKLPLILGYGFMTTWSWLRRERFDVGVTLLFVSDVLGRPLVRAARIPRLITSLRARNTNYARWKRLLSRTTMRWADDVIINSCSTRNFAICEEGAPANTIHYIPNGIRIQDYAQPLGRADLRAEFNLPPEHKLIASIGRLTPQKGFDLLLDAFAQLSRQDVDLLIIGVGQEESQLRGRASALGLDNRVHFTGYRRDVPGLLGALDLYVHSARFEGMPNVVLEAMAARCPVVAFGIDGVCELIVDGVHGWTVPPEDVGALAIAMQAALDNQAEARRRVAAAYERAAKKFSLEAMVTAWEQILLSKKPK